MGLFGSGMHSSETTRSHTRIHVLSLSLRGEIMDWEELPGIELYYLRGKIM